MAIDPPSVLVAEPAAGPPPRGLYRLLHQALLRGLRPERVPHHPPLEQRPLSGGTVVRLDVAGARGQRLACWLASPVGTAAGPRSAIVGLHGWGANASTLWPVVQPLLDQGLAVALLDASSHGDSSGEDFCSLPRFADDLATVLALLRARPDIAPERLALIGHSVGAAAVILHAARDPAICAVVSLSAFAHPQEMMERWLRAHNIPRRWPGEPILQHVQRTIGARFDDIAPVALLPRLQCPTLLVHGRRDRVVPIADGLRLHAVRRSAQWLEVEGDHDLRPALAPQVPRITDFLLRALTGSR